MISNVFQWFLMRFNEFQRFSLLFIDFWFVLLIRYIVWTFIYFFLEITQSIHWIILILFMYEISLELYTWRITPIEAKFKCIRTFQNCNSKFIKHVFTYKYISCFRSMVVRCGVESRILPTDTDTVHATDQRVLSCHLQLICFNEDRWINKLLTAMLAFYFNCM